MFTYQQLTLQLEAFQPQWLPLIYCRSSWPSRSCPSECWLKGIEISNLWNQSVTPKSNQPRNIYILKFCKTCRRGLFELSYSKYHSLSLSSFVLTERREIILHLHKIMYEVWLPGDQTRQRKLFSQITVLMWGWNPWGSLFFSIFS